MTFTVGGVDVTAVHVGATAAEAVYLGSEKVWPTVTLITWPYNGFNSGWNGPQVGKWSDGSGRLHFHKTDADGHTVDVSTWMSATWLSIVFADGKTFEGPILGTLHDDVTRFSFEHLSAKVWLDAAAYATSTTPVMRMRWT